MPIESPLTLVIGATGKTGSRVVARLEERGAAVRAGSRSGAPPFDWDDRATWAPVLDGVTNTYISYFPDLAVPGAGEAVGAFAAQAAAAGVERLVLLSGRGEPEAEEAERAVVATGVPTTILRCSWFDQNFSEGFFADLVIAGAVALPAGEVAEPFVDAGDIADVAVAALTEDGHAGETYELTGPRLLRFDEAVGEIAEAVGRPIAYVPIPAEDFTAGLRAEGLPGDLVALIAYLFAEVLDGRNATLADGVQRALGRPPRDFSGYARAAAAAGAWPAGAPVETAP